MKSSFETAARPLLLFAALYTCSIHINKYILSVLGFMYPTVFQGWQTLVAVIILRIMSNDLSSINWNSFISYLPDFICHVGAIVTGSKALSAMPVPVMISVSNSILGTETLVRILYKEDKKCHPLGIGASLLCVLSSMYLFYADPILSKMGLSSLWMLLHIICVGAQSFMVDEGVSSSFSYFDKLFYRNLFSVVVLAPSSLYLEEAFEALHFQETRQVSFVVGCILSGILGALVSVLKIKTISETFNMQAVSRVMCCLLSPLIITCSIKFVVWVPILLNIVATLFISFNNFGEVSEFLRHKVEQV